MEKMKSRKVAGPPEVNVKMIVTSDEIGVKMIIDLDQRISDDSRMSDEWKTILYLKKRVM